jgi:hypothetical protein
MRVGFLIACALMMLVPLGGLGWLRWRFRPSRMRREAERLLADAEARMAARSDDELVHWLREHPLLQGDRPSARRVRELLANRAQLGSEWPRLWPDLVEGAARDVLDDIIELNAAVNVLARRSASPASAT